MKRLSEAEYRQYAAPALRRIFISDDPYGQPFAPHITIRKLLDEFEWIAQPPLLHGIRAAAQAHHEAGFYASILDRPPAEEQQHTYHWYFTWDEIKQYHRELGPFDTATYSPAGTWAILGAEDHGLLGCIPAILPYVQAAVPDLDQSPAHFLTYCQWLVATFGTRATVDWVPDLFAHLYGNSAAIHCIFNWALQQPHTLTPISVPPTD